MNQWILSQGGFIGSFDVLWSMWSRITGPGPDHPNRTHSRPLLCFSPKTFDTGIKPQMPNKRKMKGGREKTESKSPWGNVTFLSKSYYETFPFVHSCKQHFRQSGFFLPDGDWRRAWNCWGEWVNYCLHKLWTKMPHAWCNSLEACYSCFFFLLMLVYF